MERLPSDWQRLPECTPLLSEQDTSLLCHTINAQITVRNVDDLVQQCYNGLIGQLSPETTVGVHTSLRIARVCPSKMSQVHPITKLHTVAEITQDATSSMFAIIPLELTNVDCLGTDHANVIVVDNVHKHVYHFEPHMVFTDEADIQYRSIRSQVAIFVQQYFPEYTDKSYKNTVPVQGDDLFCQSWSMLYTVLRILNPTHSDACVIKHLNLGTLLDMHCILYHEIDFAVTGRTSRSRQKLSAILQGYDRTNVASYTTG